jgi:iron complex transport system substrate-binding protein
MERLLVGADTTSLYPAVAERLPRVGYQRALSAEGLLSLAPGLILASEDAGPPAVIDQIKRAGVRWVSLKSAHTPEAPVEKLLAVGAALGQATRAAARTRQYEADWRHTQAAVAALAGRPRAVFIMAHGGPTLNLAGRDTAADAMLTLAGCDNALDFSGYKAISAESLVAAAPDVIVTTTQSVAGFGGLQALMTRPGLIDTPAARQRQAIAFDGLFLLGFGPRTPQAVMQLAQRARGQA